MPDTFHFVAGLPRCGATLIINILKQNPQIHGEAVSSLYSMFSSIHASWDEIEANKEYINESAKHGLLKATFSGYYSHIDRPIVFDKDRMWVSKIGLVERILGTKVKILCPVRSPAEILVSFERIRANNPHILTLPDRTLRERSTIAARAYYYASPDGSLGLAHACLKDAVTAGYLDRLLFIDYGRFCSNPKSQLKRIYDFFELPSFDHDLNNIVQTEQYNDQVNGLPGLHSVRPQLGKITVNPVKYIGLDLYEQYNREVFWDAWI